jgi:O-methyltransferase involved in polyketide biosynthesis
VIGTPSRTAYRVALRRAAHQVLDAPALIFADPLALAIVGAEGSQEIARSAERFDWGQPAVFAWLGVVPYLRRAAIASTPSLVGRCAAGSEIIFDYGESPDRLDPVRRAAFDLMARRVASDPAPHPGVRLKSRS